MDRIIKAGGDLVLRALTRGDGADFARYCGTPEVARQLGFAPLPLSVLGAEGFIDISNANRANGRAFDYAVVKAGTFAGVMGFWPATDSWSLGYWIARPFWGRGVATRAGDAMLRAVEQYDPDRDVTAQVFADNPASARVLEKLGFVEASERGRSYSMARLHSVETRLFRRAVRVPLEEAAE